MLPAGVLAATVASAQIGCLGGQFGAKQWPGILDVAEMIETEASSGPGGVRGDEVVGARDVGAQDRDDAWVVGSADIADDHQGVAAHVPWVALGYVPAAEIGRASCRERV